MPAYSNRFSLKAYARSVENLFSQAQTYENEGDYELAFIYAARAAKVSLEHLVKHPEYRELDSARRTALTKVAMLPHSSAISLCLSTSSAAPRSWTS